MFFRIMLICSTLVAADALWAQEVDYFRNWYKYPIANQDADDEADQQEANLDEPNLGRADTIEDGYDSESLPSPDGATSPGTLGDGNYSGTYEVGGKRYFYNQDTGEFTPEGGNDAEAETGNAELPKSSLTPGSVNTTPNVYKPRSFWSERQSGFSSSPSASSRSAGKLEIRAAGEDACQHWSHGLTENNFVSSVECRLDLDKIVELADVSLSIEFEQSDRHLRADTRVPDLVRRTTEIDRSALKNAIAAFSSAGCQCSDSNPSS